MNLTQIKSAVKNATFKLSQRAAIVGAAGVALVNNAHAAMDTTGVTTALTDAASAVAVVGAAVLVVYVGIKSFKMVKSAL